MNAYRPSSIPSWTGVMMALLTVVLSGSPDTCAQTVDPVDDAAAKPAHSCKVGSCNVTVRQIGRLTSAIAKRVLAQVHAVAFSERNDSQILLQGERLSKLRPRHMRAIKATYQAGHTIVLLDPTMLHVKALHQLIGERVSYRSKNIGQHMAYVLRKENNIPTGQDLDQSPS